MNTFVSFFYLICLNVIFSMTALAVESISFIGLGISRVGGGTEQLETGTTVNKKTGYGLTSRSYLYWTPSESRSFSYNLGISLGYNTGYGEVQFKNGNIEKSVDTDFTYVGVGLSNGVRFNLSRDLKVAFDLGLDFLPLSSTLQLRDSGSVIEYDFKKAISWHVQIASYYNITNATDFALGSRYEISKIFESDGSNWKMYFSHINVGIRHKFVPDNNYGEYHDNGRGKKKSRRRIAKRRLQKRYIVVAEE